MTGLHSNEILAFRHSSRSVLNVEVVASFCTGDPDGPGPIRIRNLEDLIRQLERSSRHMSPTSAASEDIRETEAERHFR